jgi:hypothetical protein
VAAGHVEAHAPIPRVAPHSPPLGRADSLNFFTLFA